MDEPSVLASPNITAHAASFEDFVVSEQQKLYGALCLLTRDRGQAEDLMQEAFLRLWERWDRVVALDDPAGYLYRTARQPLPGNDCDEPRSRCAARSGHGHRDGFQDVDQRDEVIRALGRLTEAAAHERRPRRSPRLLLGGGRSDHGHQRFDRPRLASQDVPRSAGRKVTPMPDISERLRAASDRFEPPHDVLDALHHRRERRERIRRRTTVAVSLTLFFALVAGLAIWVSDRGESRRRARTHQDRQSVRRHLLGRRRVDRVRVWRRFPAVTPDGSEETVLLGRRDLHALDWAPDGSRLLVTLDEEGGSPWDLAVIEPDGSETTLVRFDDDTLSINGASFSPDGATVVYGRWAGVASC